MKKVLFAVMLFVVAAQAVAAATGAEAPVTEAQLESVIDTRLHELLVQLNAQKK